MREKQKSEVTNPHRYQYQIKVATPDNKLLQQNPKTGDDDKKKSDDRTPVSESDLKSGYGSGMWNDPFNEPISLTEKKEEPKEVDETELKEAPVKEIDTSKSGEASVAEKKKELTQGVVKASDSKVWTVSQFFEHYNAYDITDKNFTDEELKFFETYRDDAQKYLDRPNMVWTVKTNLTGEAIANAARRTYLKYGRDFSKVLPVTFVLAQAQLETSLGADTKGNRNNAFNIGEYDSGTRDWVEKITDPEMGTAMYMDLMAEDYLSKRTPEDLLKDGGYLNEQDNRYASDKSYEEGLRNQINFNKRYIEKATPEGKVEVSKRVVGNYHGKAFTNQIEDLQLIQYKLNEIGLLSDEDYVKEGVRKKELTPEKLATIRHDGTKNTPESESGSLGSADTVAISELSATIKAIETFQQKVMKVGSTVDGWIQIGGTTHGALMKSTPELTAMQLRTYKQRQARYDSDQYFAKEAEKAIERTNKQKAAKERAKKEAEKQAAKPSLPTKEEFLKIHEDSEDEAIANELLCYVYEHPKFVKAVINDSGYFRSDNIAFYLTKGIDDLSKLNSGLLLSLKSNLESGYTVSEEEEQIIRLKEAITGKLMGVKSSEKSDFDNHKLKLKRGVLTIVAEGSDEQTKYVHWPKTDASGVTLGKGYDCGNRSEKFISRDLVKMGMEKNQAKLISKSAGLKGKNAEEWVRKNKKKVGEIPLSVQYKLFNEEFNSQKNTAKELATKNYKTKSNINARSRELKKGKPSGTYRMTEDEWESIHPAIMEYIVDLKYRGDYGWDRIEWVNEIVKNKELSDLEKLKALKKLNDGALQKYTKGVPRRSRLRSSYLTLVIEAMESGKEIEFEKFNADEDKKYINEFIAYDQNLTNKNKLLASVGKDGKNNPADIKKVKKWLKQKGYSVTEGNKWQEADHQSLISFQEELINKSLLKSKYKDGRVDVKGTTIKYLSI
ncbi:lysozyme family protein [Marinigracilibium pacificum]|uniref:Uncharacterized protein n=1 Tax=Marinigracilibium pacificum TaxID=2729599 RepID=A0A848J2T2_9BACT|nr:hypothetical protein [Marinigracilibium pacificum]NMM50907.1 hypothetical protein [Marinigracilibium pacificum]